MSEENQAAQEASVEAQQAAMAQTPVVEDTSAPIAEPEGSVTYMADAEDETKVATVTGGDAELTEEQIIALLSGGDEIRDSQTVAGGRYIISVKAIPLSSKAIQWVHSVDAQGNMKLEHEKSVGFSYGIHYDMQSKEVMDEHGYQVFHLAKRDGSKMKNGSTDYKRFCADICAAAIRAYGSPDQANTTIDNVLKHFTDKKLPPVVGFNSLAGSTDDNVRYFFAQIKEIPARDGYPASNQIVTGSFKEGADEYMQGVLNS